MKYLKMINVPNYLFASNKLYLCYALGLHEKLQDINLYLATMWRYRSDVDHFFFLPLSSPSGAAALRAAVMRLPSPVMNCVMSWYSSCCCFMVWSQPESGPMNSWRFSGLDSIYLTLWIVSTFSVVLRIEPAEKPLLISASVLSGKSERSLPPLRSMKFFHMSLLVE